MKKYLSIVLGIFLFSIFSIVSCKDAEVVEIEKSKKEIRTEQILGQWHFDSMYNHLTDKNLNLDPCNKDDSYTYNSDGTNFVSVGTLKCNPSDRDTTVNWEISAEGDSMIHRLGTESRLAAYIESISDNQLIYLVGSNNNTIVRLYYSRK